jgi:bifunctional DNA-binding transcriptional regulator/antitoxin component of YhaV-PrlF toxin-antitoxin module
MTYASTRIASGGRLVIPVALRRALGMEDGTAVTMSVKDGELRVHTVSEGVRRAQAIFAKYNNMPGVSIVDELVGDRRAEAFKDD